MSLSFFDGEWALASLSVSNGTLYAIAALLLIVCALFWLFGRWR